MCISFPLQPRLLEICSLSFHPSAQDFPLFIYHYLQGKSKAVCRRDFCASPCHLLCCTCMYYTPSLTSLSPSSFGYLVQCHLLVPSLPMALFSHLLKIFSTHTHCEKMNFSVPFLSLETHHQKRDRYRTGHQEDTGYLINCAGLTGPRRD